MAMWMIYAAAVAALLAAGGLALEGLCERADVPRRYVWLGALTLAVAIPLTANPRERGEGPPMGATGNPETGTVVGAAKLPSNDRLTDTGRAQPGQRALSTSATPLFVWAFASLLVFTALATVLMLSLRARRRWDKCRIGDERVYVSRRFGPALVGIVRPAIVIPRWVLRLGEAVGATVVKHEREHARAGDHLALLYAALVAVVFPWSPAIWWMCRRLGAAVEIDCDRRVIASGVPASEYGKLLLGIGAARQGGGLFALGMATSESVLERRLRTMSRESGRIGRPMSILLGGLALASVATACDMPAPTSIAPVVEGVLAARTAAPLEQPATDREQKGNAAVSRAFDEEDGRILVRGRNRSPYLSLTPASVARDPLVLLDGRIVEGGLESLVSMVDTLNFGSVGFDGSPNAVEKYGERAAGGTVLISTRGSAGRSIGRVWQRWTARWRVAERDWRDTEAAWQDAERKSDETEGVSDAARGKLRAAERELKAARGEPKGTEWTGTILERATGPDGRVRIQGIDSLPAITLRADVAARNPRAQVDGRYVEGGLRTLLTMMDTLNFVSGGYYGIPPRVVINTARPDETP